MKRQAGSGSGSSPRNNILSSYRITFNFELPENLTDISRADLLLFQSSQLGPEYVVRDRKQYVEIKTVLDTLGQFVVEGKYIDVYDQDYQVFDVTSAVKLWIAKSVNGSVNLEVIVYCYSTTDCNQPRDGKQPAKVNFLYDTDDVAKAPRLITISKNPIEADHQNRFRRSTDGPGVRACGVNQTTCCLKPLTINFVEDLGPEFGFILSPEQFQSNYCEGYCLDAAGGQLMTPQLFEFLSHLGDGHPASSIEPCCAGNTYRPLEVLMRVNGILVIEELQQVIVSSCRCA